MKKFFALLFAITLVTTLLHAQTSSGNMMVGGSIDITSVSRQAGSQYSSSAFTFSPSFGYFVGDHLAVGASLSLGSSRSGTGSGKQTSSQFGIGPFARYYLFSSNESLAFFGQAGLAFGTKKTEGAPGVQSHTSSVTFALSPGAAYFFNEHGSSNRQPYSGAAVP